MTQIDSNRRSGCIRLVLLLKNGLVDFGKQSSLDTMGNIDGLSRDKRTFISVMRYTSTKITLQPYPGRWQMMRIVNILPSIPWSSEMDQLRIWTQADGIHSGRCRGIQDRSRVKSINRCLSAAFKLYPMRTRWVAAEGGHLPKRPTDGESQGKVCACSTCERPPPPPLNRRCSTKTINDTRLTNYIKLVHVNDLAPPRLLCLAVGW